MKRILVLLFVVAMSDKVACADTWARPVERLYLSDNKQYAAQVTPVKNDSPATLKVFLARDRESRTLWHCTLGNEGAPQDVFITNDGKYVVTVNENSSRVHGGMGDYVLAFYNRRGLIKNYSLEQILHYPDRIDQREFRKLARRSVSGRSWVSRPMFIDSYGDSLYFCLWLVYGERWLAWEVSSGEEVKVSNDMVKRWNEKGRLWALHHGLGSNYYQSALQFLGRFKKHEDREFIESFLTSRDFYTSYEERNRKFVRYYCWSAKRMKAESVLAAWDGKPAKKPSRNGQKYNYLGVVDGTIKLPRPPKAGDRYLCIYLIPSSKARSQWYNEVPAHRLTAYFSEFSFHNCQWPGSAIPFLIQGVTPGEYWIKAVWDRAKPYYFEDNYIKGPPQEGDYESIEPLVITVKAGEKVENVIIDCTHAVSNGTK
ncbi:MAG: hypothetical protein ACYSUX_00630 [Planctomycetota bacterium]